MPPLSELGRKPATVTADEHFAPWFGTLADRLMNNCDLVIAGSRYRFAELEMYYSGGPHPDLVVDTQYRPGLHHRLRRDGHDVDGGVRRAQRHDDGG